MAHSYIAFIDESGCSGRKFLTGSSDFLVMSAAIIPTWWEDRTKDLFDHARTLRNSTKTFKKFSDLRDNRRHILSSVFPLYPIATCHVALYKPLLGELPIAGDQSKEYAYLLKLTLERISWFVRDQDHPHDPNDRRCRLVFSENRALPYEDIHQYLVWLKIARGAFNCSVNWEFIDTSQIETQPHVDETPIHLADIAASALGFALKGNVGTPDDRFIRNISDTIYRRHGRCYGLKFFPAPTEEHLAETRRLDFVRLIDPNRTPALSKQL